MTREVFVINANKIMGEIINNGSVSEWARNKVASITNITSGLDLTAEDVTEGDLQNTLKYLKGILKKYKNNEEMNEEEQLVVEELRKEE